MSNLFQTMKNNGLKSLLIIILIVILFYLVSLNDLIFRLVLLCLSLVAVGIALFVLNKVMPLPGISMRIGTPWQRHVYLRYNHCLIPIENRWRIK